MKSIIVLGMTYNQVPLVEKAREMGYRTIVIGAGGGPPVAAECADAAFPIDTSDLEAVSDLAVRENAAGLVTCGTSTPMCTVAYVTEKLGLSKYVISYDTALKSVHKDRFRDIIGDLLPRGTSSFDADSTYQQSISFDYPLILKPGDGGGGKGITVVDELDKEAFHKAFAYAQEFSRSKRVIVEEFVDGEILGAESFTLDGHVQLLAIADKIITEPPRCITLGVAFPSRLPVEVQDRIRDVNEAAVSRLGIRWGPTHIDMAVNRNGRPKIIDIGPRLPGGHIMSTLIPAAYGYDFHKATIQLALGIVPSTPGGPDTIYYGYRFMISPKPGMLGSIDYTQADMERYSIGAIRQLVPNGTVLGDAENDGSRLIMFTSKGDSYDALIANLDDFSSRVRITVT